MASVQSDRANDATDKVWKILAPNAARQVDSSPLPTTYMIGRIITILSYYRPLPATRNHKMQILNNHRPIRLHADNTEYPGAAV